MGKVLWHTTMSLDGYIAAPDGGLDWMFTTALPNPTGSAVIPTIGAIVAGRGTYDQGMRGSGRPYGGAWQGPIFVLTHRPATDPGVTFVADLPDSLDRARAAAGDRDVAVFGAGIARECLTRGLLDELLIHLVPVLLGDGVPLYRSAGGEPIALDLLSVAPPGEVPTLRLRPRQSTAHT